MYVFSDFLYLLFFYVFQYRKKIVIENLTRSFPEKSEVEIRIIAKKFYRHLSDILLEGIKGFKMSKKQILKRHRLVNPEFLDSYFEKGKSVIGVAAHYGNWEWGSLSGGLQTRFKLIVFYKPLSNGFVNNLLKKSRAQCGTTLSSITETNKTFYHNKNTKAIYMLVSDQSPSNYKQAYWVNFLNRETACLYGVEKYARIYNYPVLYVHFKRVKRGYYDIEISELVRDPSETKDSEITSLYFKKLEDIIRSNPSDWLWSHRRWKKTRNEAETQA